MYRLAILDDYERAALELGDWDRIRQHVTIDVYSDHITAEDALVKRLLPYDIVLIMRERTPFPRRLIEKLPSLKLLVTTGPRNSAIDISACTDKGIVVCGTGSAKNAAGELTWALILSLLRKTPQADRETREGKWGNILGTELSGKTLGVLGLGKIGTMVANVGRAFGMHIIAWSQNLTPERASECNAEWVEKDALFERSDILTIHVVLSDRTRGLIGARELALMQPAAFIVNTSRGPIIDEKALVGALKEGRIAGAGIDVYDMEPLPGDHAFLAMPNTVLTPHIGYVTRDNFKTYFTQAVEDIAAWMDRVPIRVLNPAT